MREKQKELKQELEETRLELCIVKDELKQSRQREKDIELLQIKPKMQEFSTQTTPIKQRIQNMKKDTPSGIVSQQEEELIMS